MGSHHPRRPLLGAAQMDANHAPASSPILEMCAVIRQIMPEISRRRLGARSLVVVGKIHPQPRETGERTMHRLYRPPPFADGNAVGICSCLFHRGVQARAGAVGVQACDRTDSERAARIPERNLAGFRVSGGGFGRAQTLSRSAPHASDAVNGRKYRVTSEGLDTALSRAWKKIQFGFRTRAGGRNLRVDGIWNLGQIRLRMELFPRRQRVCNVSRRSDGLDSRCATRWMSAVTYLHLDPAWHPQGRMMDGSRFDTWTSRLIIVVSQFRGFLVAII